MYAPSSEVAFLLFLLHGANLIVVDQAAGAFRCAGAERFGDDFFKRGGGGFLRWRFQWANPEARWIACRVRRSGRCSRAFALER